MIAVCLIIFALCGPAWRSVTTTTVPGRLLVLVDHSASMQRSDGPPGAAADFAATALYNGFNGVESLANTSIEWRAIGGVNGPVDASALTAEMASGLASSWPMISNRPARRSPRIWSWCVSDFRATEGSSLGVAADRLSRLGQSAWGLGVGTTELDAELFIEEVSGNSIVALGEEQPFLLRFAARSLDQSQPITVRVLNGVK